MAAVHAYIAYDSDRTTHLHALTHNQLAASLRNDLRALRILHPPAANISLTNNQIHFWWPKAGQNVWQGISNAIDRWFTEDAFREVQSEMGIENVVLREPRTSPSSSATPSPPPPPKASRKRKRARSPSPSPIQLQRAKRTRPELRSDTRNATTASLDTTRPLPKLKKPQHFKFMHPSRVALLSEPTPAPPTKEEVEETSLLASPISRKRGRSSSPLSLSPTKRPRQESPSASAPIIHAPKPTYPSSPLPNPPQSLMPSQIPAPTTPPPPKKRRHPKSRSPTPEWAKTPTSSQLGLLTPPLPFYTPTQSPAPLFKEAPPQSPTLEEGNQRIREWVAQTSKIAQEVFDALKEKDLKEKEEGERGRKRGRKSRFADRKTPPGSPQMLCGFPPLTRLAVPRVVPPPPQPSVEPISARVLGKRRERSDEESVKESEKGKENAEAPLLITPQSSTTLSSASSAAPERERKRTRTATLYETKIKLGWDPITKTWGESSGPGGRSMTSAAGEPSKFAMGVEKSTLVTQLVQGGGAGINPARTSPNPKSKSTSPANTNNSPPTSTTNTTTTTNALTPLLLTQSTTSSTSLSESPLPSTPVEVVNSSFWEVPKSPYHGVPLSLDMFPLLPGCESSDKVKGSRATFDTAAKEPYTHTTPKSPVLNNSIWANTAPPLTPAVQAREDEENVLIHRYLSLEPCKEVPLTKAAWLEKVMKENAVALDVKGDGDKSRKVVVPTVSVKAGKWWNSIGDGLDGDDTLIRDTLHIHT